MGYESPTDDIKYYEMLLLNMPMVYLSGEAEKALDECARLFSEFAGVTTTHSQTVIALFKLSAEVKAFQRVKLAEKAVDEMNAEVEP